MESRVEEVEVEVQVMMRISGRNEFCVGSDKNGFFANHCNERPLLLTYARALVWFAILYTIPPLLL